MTGYAHSVRKEPGTSKGVLVPSDLAIGPREDTPIDRLPYMRGAEEQSVGPFEL